MNVRLNIQPRIRETFCSPETWNRDGSKSPTKGNLIELNKHKVLKKGGRIHLKINKRVRHFLMKIQGKIQNVDIMLCVRYYG